MLALQESLRFEIKDFALAGRELGGERSGFGVFGLIGGPLAPRLRARHLRNEPVERNLRLRLRSKLLRQAAVLHVAAPLRALLLRSKDFEPEWEGCLNVSLATTVTLPKRASVAAQLTFAGPWRLPSNPLRDLLVLSESTLLVGLVCGA